MIQPLDGVTVVDLSRALAGPYCTALLADLGANVIKVESLNGGDTARQWPPFENGHSLYFDSVNRNKRSVCLDFYSAEGRELLEKLISGCDVLVENFKLGTLQKMGFGTDRLKELNPDLIVASINGFGTVGPLRDDAGLDQVIQGMSGLVSVTGEDAEHSYRVGVPIVDIASGMVTALGIVAALLGRTNGHPVGVVSTSLLETALGLSVFQGQRALSLGETPTPQGNDHPTIAPYGVFTTASESITIAVANDRQFGAFCALIGEPDAATDARFASGADRSAHRHELGNLIDAALSSRSAEEWVPLIAGAGIPCGPIYNYTQILASEQVAALELIRQTARHDGSALPLLRGPLSLDGKASEVRSAPPLLGEHTAEILREIGLSDSEIARLEAAGHLRTIVG